MARPRMCACDRLLLAVTASACLFVAACGGARANPGAPDGSSPADTGIAADDGGIPAPGMATLVGPPAFEVASATMGIPTSGACGGGGGSSSVISQITILLASPGLPSLCTDGGAPDGGPGEWLDLELATTQAATGATELTESLTPGTYAIGDEEEDDPDVCKIGRAS